MSPLRVALSIRVLAVAGCVAVVGAGALAVRALIPEADRVTRAIALANREAKRDQPLQLQLAVRIAGGPVVAQGELETQPNGLARLELRGAEGLRERHLLHSAGHYAARNGQRLEEPRALLPPLFLLQMDSLQSVESSLEGFGINPRLVGLVRCGSENCYVLGDPTRVAPPPEPEEEPTDESAGQATGEPPLGEAKEAAKAPPASTPLHGNAEVFGSFWVEKESFEPRRLRSPGGTRIEFGAVATFGSVRLPTWFEIWQPQHDSIRFEIQGVSASRLSPGAFSTDWVMESPLP